ncbi:MULTISPECIES: hypothetical protein [unclassified Chryseobacterium]|uniref:hypothetical protein n=1 Tax=unclassified Chryseobacterium TaxID=2593645 RepID=UPI00100C2EE2|nr:MULTISPECIES: hypothetical protein [unclassified Chryseobacterium]RXM51793.1 hypothetical protein BOQ64_12870 [Chryseobacterium sp. CH25]RXM67370.1 hypothetical protein BOQ60_05585 [Chryseobacterium sp. CH1]
MKNFIKYDLYVQLFFLITGCLVTIIKGWDGWILFYFIVGIPQLISFFVKIFLKIKISPLFLIYGIVILPVWISMVILKTLEIDHQLIDIPVCIVVMAFFYSPFMALLYVFESHNLYNSLK